MYENNITRIASSNRMFDLFGDTSKYQSLLLEAQAKLISEYQDEVLKEMFSHIYNRVINICPMVMADAVLRDLGIKAPDDLLVGLGLSAYSISTHDDVVDELPENRDVIAGLVYAGNIATLEGIKILSRISSDVVQAAVENINLNHLYQTSITRTLWRAPASEEVYLRSINHTRYWVKIGLSVAMAYAKISDKEDDIDRIADYYGTTCQLIDDVLEVEDDLKNKYWSLPISNAHFSNEDIRDEKIYKSSIQRSVVLARARISAGLEITESRYPSIHDIFLRMSKYDQR